jgi:hypothetical protein
MSRYITTPSYVDSMPVDISFVFEAEKPAGKHGFMQACGDDFRFEDGTLGKFWGVCMNGGACFPTHEYAEKVADRLAMVGVNCVRLHQLDGEYHTPNIFCFRKGKRLDNTRSLDPKSMERLDYFYEVYTEQWMEENKPFGFEIQDLRMGGLSRRVKHCRDRLQAYVDGKLMHIEELEAPVLDIQGEQNVCGEALLYTGWTSIVSANVL